MDERVFSCRKVTPCPLPVYIASGR
jgi:hypothetical protein